MFVGKCPLRIPFEFHAYEAIFTTVKVVQSKKLEKIQCAAADILSEMKKGSLMPLKLQEEMRELKNTASQMAEHVDRYRKALSELIMDDADMALMNLTKLRANPSLYR